MYTPTHLRAGLPHGRSWYLERAPRVKQLSVDFCEPRGNDMTLTALGTLVAVLCGTLEELKIACNAQVCPLIPSQVLELQSDWATLQFHSMTC